MRTILGLKGHLTLETSVISVKVLVGTDDNTQPKTLNIILS